MTTTTPVGARPRKGESCPESGRWRFDWYLDGSTSPPPRAEETEIPLRSGETFPPIRSTGKACRWKLILRIWVLPEASAIAGRFNPPNGRAEPQRQFEFADRPRLGGLNEIRLPLH